jgi:hypothetical protein
MTRRRERAVIALLMAAIAMFPSPVSADMVKAEDVAYRMATSYVAKSFNLSPTMQSSILAGGQFVRYTIPVARGVDYVILVGSDDAVLNTGIYVYDEVGGLILDDVRGKSRAGVQFRSSYSGSVYAYVYAARVRGAFGAVLRDTVPPEVYARLFEPRSANNPAPGSAPRRSPATRKSCRRFASASARTISPPCGAPSIHD